LQILTNQTGEGSLVLRKIETERAQCIDASASRMFNAGPSAPIPQAFRRRNGEQHGFRCYHDVVNALTQLPATIVALTIACSACTSERMPAVPRNAKSAQPRQALQAQSAGPSQGDLRCDVPNGVTFHGKRRYVHGANYAWGNFGADYGGLAQWGMRGVGDNPAPMDAAFRAMAAAGASVIRVWLFPDTRGDGILKDTGGNPVGVSSGALADIDATLDLAAKHNIHVLFTLFSFDAFKDTWVTGGRTVQSIAPAVRNDLGVQTIITQVVRPIVERASTGPNAARVFAWDLMNEPEWATADLGASSSCGIGEGKYNCVDYRRMHHFLTALSAEVSRVVASLPETTKSLITIGAVRPSAHRNWETVPQDFYQYHYYQNEYAAGDMELPRTDKPSIIGEYPSWGLRGESSRGAKSGPALAEYIRNSGFQGGLAWAYTKSDSKADWPNLQAVLKPFADAQGCKARF
jgi:hypothetical protein